MRKLNPDKVFVEYRQEVTETEPIIPRKYTLTHSDETGDLFLTIGNRYAYDKITEMRDEVLGEWKLINDNYIYYAYVHVDDQFNYMNSYIRNMIFIRELPLALETIRYGDRKFFDAHPCLDEAPIYIYFHSYYPAFNRVEYWGTFGDYK